MSSCQHHSLGRSIYLTSQAMRNHVERTLKPYDLTGEQFHLLKNLTPDKGRPQSDLSGLTGKSPANITRILDRLVRKKLVTRRNNPADRRSSLVFQTENGLQLVKEVTALLASLSETLESGIKAEELVIFKKVLIQIEENLNKLSEHSGE